MPQWRWPSWLIAIWTVLAVLLMTAVYLSGITDKTEHYEPFSFLLGCIIVGFVIWAMPMVALAPIWYFTRKQQIRCPGCGFMVETSWNMCPRCGYRPQALAYTPFGTMPGQVPPQYPGVYQPPALNQFPLPTAWPSTGWGGSNGALPGAQGPMQQPTGASSAPSTPNQTPSQQPWDGWR